MRATHKSASLPIPPAILQRIHLSIPPLIHSPIYWPLHASIPLWFTRLPIRTPIHPSARPFIHSFIALFYNSLYPSPSVPSLYLFVLSSIRRTRFIILVCLCLYIHSKPSRSTDRRPTNQNGYNCALRPWNTRSRRVEDEYMGYWWGDLLFWTPKTPWLGKFDKHSWPKFPDTDFLFPDPHWAAIQLCNFLVLPSRILGDFREGNILWSHKCRIHGLKIKETVLWSFILWYTPGAWIFQLLNPIPTLTLTRTAICRALPSPPVDIPLLCNFVFR